MCKVRCFYSQIVNIGAVLQCFFKPLQNRSEELKTSVWATKCCIWLAFYSGFRKTTRETRYKNAYFRGAGRRGPRNITKAVVWRARVAPTAAGAPLLTKMRSVLERGGSSARNHYFYCTKRTSKNHPGQQGRNRNALNKRRAGSRPDPPKKVQKY